MKATKDRRKKAATYMLNPAIFGDYTNCKHTRMVCYGCTDKH
jgi:hypothetical protein